MSLIELVMAAGFLSVITLGTSTLLQENIRSRVQADGKKNALSEISGLQAGMKLNTRTSGQCSTFVSLDNSSFSATGETPLQISLQNKVYKSNTEFGVGAGRVRIDRLYLGQVQPISSSNTEKIYAATTIIESSNLENGQWKSLPKRSIGSLSLRIGSSNQMLDCSAFGFNDMNETICRSINGMRWIPNAQECIQDIESDAQNNFVACPGGTQRNAAGACVPNGSGCFNQYLPQSFGRGAVDTCSRVPATYAVSYPPDFTPVPEPQTPTPSGPISCKCGQYDITNTATSGRYCVSCYKDRNARPFGESDYYYTVEKCGSGGALERINGPTTNGSLSEGGQFKDQSDPPQNGKCERERSPGTLNGNNVVQLRNP